MTNVTWKINYKHQQYFFSFFFLIQKEVCPDKTCKKLCDLYFSNYLYSIYNCCSFLLNIIINYLFFVWINGIITIEFFASDIRHHLPSLCSWPIPAISWVPSEVKHSALTNPVNCISNSGFNDLKESPHCHNLITPFRDPIFDNYEKRLKFFHKDKWITYLKKKVFDTWCN